MPVAVALAGEQGTVPVARVAAEVEAVPVAVALAGAGRSPGGSVAVEVGRRWWRWLRGRWRWWRGRAQSGWLRWRWVSRRRRRTWTESGRIWRRRAGWRGFRRPRLRQVVRAQARGAGPGGGRMGGDAGFGGPRGGAGAGGFGQGGRGGFGGPGAQGPGGDRFSAPNRGQLNSFLGMPSDEGFHGAGSAGVGRGNVGVGGDAGIGGGRAGAGAGGVGGVGVGGDAGIGGGRAGVGAGGVGRPGVGVGGVGRPGVGVGGVGRPGVGVGGVGGCAPVSASARYTTAAAVRTNYDHWGFYDRDWYARYPGAWNARAGRPEPRGARARGATRQLTVATPRRRRCTTTTATTSPTKTTTCTSMAQTWARASSITIKLPASHRRALRRRRRQTATGCRLGVFALTESDKTKSDVSLQLAVNKQGVIRGNSTDTVTNKNQVIQGSVDKQTQRVAFTVGDNTTNVVETGLYNLTKDEAPCLIHFGKDKTEQWLLVRMQKPDAADAPNN